MNIFDRKSTLILLLVCLPLLYLPKVNIIKLMEGETAGLRIDDFILFFFAFIFFWAHLTLKKGLLRIEVWILSIVVFSFLSYLSNKILVSSGVLFLHSKLFYCVRLFEYFLFFYVGAFAAGFFSLNSIVLSFLLWNVILMVFQKLGVIGEFSSSYEGYTADGTYRASGIASFPSEMGALLSMIFCYFLFLPESFSGWRDRLSQMVRKLFDRTFVYLLFFLFAGLIIMTGSRIAIVAILLPFLFKIKELLSLKSISTWGIALVFTSILIAAVTYTIMETESITVRSKGLLSWRNLALAGLVWDAQDVESAEAAEFLNVVSYEEYDMSWWMRIHKWCYALKAYFYHPQTYLQGLGPGFAWLALDGGFIRIFVEYGLFGYFLFWKLAQSIYQKSVQLKWVLVAFLINMIFFDIYLAYKPMSLLFLMTGYSYAFDNLQEKMNLNVSIE